MIRFQSLMSLAIVSVISAGLNAAPSESTPAKPAEFVKPELPRQLIDTSLPQQHGKVKQVAADGDLQAALNEAQPGDTIVLAAGATYKGTIVLPKKSGEGWIMIQSSAVDKLVPGTRVTPKDAANMPKILATHNNEPALRADQGAHHYRIIGVEFAPSPEVKKLGGIVEISHESPKLEDVPDHIIFDRVYIHGDKDFNAQRGLALNARFAAVIDSWISECHIHGFDSQAIGVWDGPGPFKIVNNFLEAGAENIMFGGAKDSAEDMVASDIEIRRNHLFKDPKWHQRKYPDNWVIKNVFEIKTARRVLLEGNVLENCWTDGQVGFAFVLKSSAPSQGQPWDTTNDLTIRYNRIINTENGVSICRWASEGPVVPGAQPTSRILFEQNLFEHFGAQSDYAKSNEDGMMFQVSGVDLTFRHNTAWNGYNMMSLPDTGCDNLVFCDNLMTPGSYAIHPDGAGAGWLGGLGKHIRGNSRMEGNTIIREGSERAQQTVEKDYPPGNLWFDTFKAAGVDPKTYRLLPDSKAKKTATDHSDPGADVDAVMKATEGVRTVPE